MSIVFVDTETTGLDPDWHEIWEVGAIWQPEGSEDWIERAWQLPVDLGRADTYALKLSGFHERRGITNTLDGFARDFAEITRGKHLCGAVVSFDEERLRKLLRTHGACPEWHYHLVDVEALVAGFLMGQFTAIQEVGKNPEADGPTVEEAKQAVPPWDSEALSRAVGIEPEEYDRHTALADARWAKAMYEAVLS